MSAGAINIFGRPAYQFGGAFSADSSLLFFSGPPGSGGGYFGLLVQNFQTSFRQQVLRVFELGSTRVYYVRGRAEGNLAMSRVLGPAPLMKIFYQTYGNPCFAPTNTISFIANVGCGRPDTGGATINFTFLYCVLANWEMSANVENMLLAENIQMTYIDCII